MDDLDRLLSEQNIARYRKLLDASTDENERAVILELIAEEIERLKADPPPKLMDLVTIPASGQLQIAITSL